MHQLCSICSHAALQTLWLTIINRRSPTAKLAGGEIMSLNETLFLCFLLLKHNLLILNIRCDIYHQHNWIIMQGNQFHNKRYIWDVVD